MTAAFDRVISALEANGKTVRSTGTARASAQCPAHEDGRPSLSVTGTEGRTLLFRQAGCRTDDVLAALRLRLADLFDDSRGSAYRYDNGRLVLRTPDKRFSQRNTDRAPELYRLGAVRAAVVAGKRVLVVEGEADVHAAEAVGAVATCSPMGARTWGKVDPTPLQGADVVVVADRDEAGRRHAQDVADSVGSIARSVAVVQAATGKDLSDHIAAGHTLDELVPAGITAADPFAAAIAEAAAKLRINEAARALVQAEKAAAVRTEPFDAGTLTEILARPAEPPHRVEGLMPSDGGTLVVAQRKTGKTTFQLNLARCLLTGEDFLGRFPVRPVTGTVAVLNFEVSGQQLGRWASDVDVPEERLYLVNLRGRRNPLSDPEDRARLAAQLRTHGVESLIVDPFGRAYTGTSQNDPGEVGSWLADLDLFARTEVGAVDVILAAHAGWNGERTRGSSALED